MLYYSSGSQILADFGAYLLKLNHASIRPGDIVHSALKKGELQFREFKFKELKRKKKHELELEKKK